MVPPPQRLLGGSMVPKMAVLGGGVEPLTVEPLRNPHIVQQNALEGNHSTPLAFCLRCDFFHTCPCHCHMS